MIVRNEIGSMGNQLTAAEEWRLQVERERGPVLTVGVLHRLLWGVPDWYKVYSEGCDCSDEAGSITVSHDNHIVTIERRVA